MKFKRVAVASAALVLACVVVSAFLAQVYQQSNFDFSYQVEQNGRQHLKIYSSKATLDAITINEYTMLGLASSINLQTPSVNQAVLANTTRCQLYEYINQNPGVQFRALCSALCLPVGLAEYHLGVLVRAGLVSFIRDGRYKRFFISKRFSKREMMLICVLRHKTAKKIVETLLRKRELSHGKLAWEVAISSQALTWQMKTLGSTELLMQVNDGLKTVYSLNHSSKPLLEKCLAVVE